MNAELLEIVSDAVHAGWQTPNPSIDRAPKTYGNGEKVSVMGLDRAQTPGAGGSNA